MLSIIIIIAIFLSWHSDHYHGSTIVNSCNHIAKILCARASWYTAILTSYYYGFNSYISMKTAVYTCHRLKQSLETNHSLFNTFKFSQLT